MVRSLVEFFKIPESVRIPGIWGPAYRLAIKLDNKSILKERLPKNPLNREKRDEILTVSLTSFPARIGTVHLAIKSLMLQSYKPDRIVLWLAEDQFPRGERELPDTLLALKEKGLEIRFCENLYGHKKYFVALQEQKENELVATFDDDIIYPPNALKKLIKCHKKFPDAIICNRAQALDYEKNGSVKDVGRWKTITSVGVRKRTFCLCPSTGGGCLYPYGALNAEAFDAEKIKTLALRADDQWILFMSVYSGTPIVKSVKYHKTFSVVQSSQEESLAAINILGAGYKQVMADLESAYPHTWRKILGEENDGV